MSVQSAGQPEPKGPASNQENSPSPRASPEKRCGSPQENGWHNSKSFGRNAFPLPQPVPCCPGTRVFSAEVPPSSCRDLEELSLTRLPVCTRSAGEKPAHKQTSIFFYQPWHPGGWRRRGSGCCRPPWSRAGVFRARTGCKLFISPMLGVFIVGFQMTSAAMHL